MKKKSKMIEDAVQGVLYKKSQLKMALKMLDLQIHILRNTNDDGYEQTAIPPEVNEAIRVMHSYLYKKMIEMWEQLSWYSAISDKASNELKMKLKTWFQKKDGSIRSFVGNAGYTYGEDDFRKEVLKMIDEL